MSEFLAAYPDYITTSRLDELRAAEYSPRRDLPAMDHYLDLVGMPSGGAVRVSLGLVSNISDVERFLDFAEQTYRDTEPDRGGLAPRLRC